MVKVILTSIITYISTTIDEIPVLFMLYIAARNKGKGKTITLSYFAGTFLLIAAGLIGAFGLVLISIKWVIGLFGIIPVIMGLKTLIKGDGDEDEAMEAGEKFNSLGLKVFVITLLLGADDLGIYIPLFSTIRGWDIVLMLSIFFIGTSISCLISYKLTQFHKLQSLIEKRERHITGIVFIAIGLLVNFEYIYRPLFIH